MTLVSKDAHEYQVDNGISQKTNHETHDAIYNSGSSLYSIVGLIVALLAFAIVNFVLTSVFK